MTYSTRKTIELHPRQDPNFARADAESQERLSGCCGEEIYSSAISAEQSRPPPRVLLVSRAFTVNAVVDCALFSPELRGEAYSHVSFVGL